MALPAKLIASAAVLVSPTCDRRDRARSVPGAKGGAEQVTLRLVAPSLPVASVLAVGLALCATNGRLMRSGVRPGSAARSLGCTDRRDHADLAAAIEDYPAPTGSPSLRSVKTV